MNNSAITFSQLCTKLKSYGFTVHSFELDNGRKGRIFMRKKEPRTNIYLPDYGDEDTVENYHLFHVLATLKARGLIEDSNPLLT